jgi:hypothetical protein
MPEFEFTLFLDGVDVLSDEAQERLEQLAVPSPVDTGEPRRVVTPVANAGIRARDYKVALPWPAMSFRSRPSPYAHDAPIRLAPL